MAFSGFAIVEFIDPNNTRFYESKDSSSQIELSTKEVELPARIVNSQGNRHAFIYNEKTFWVSDTSVFTNKEPDIESVCGQTVLVMDRDKHSGTAGSGVGCNE